VEAVIGGRAGRDRRVRIGGGPDPDCAGTAAPQRVPRFNRADEANPAALPAPDRGVAAPSAVK
jgi:hypothetical protein